MKPNNPKIIKCSKCGGTDITKPVNIPDIIYICMDCGHSKLEATIPMSRTMPRESEEF